MRVKLNFVLLVDGGWCVVIPGTSVMPLLLADSWDTILKVVTLYQQLYTDLGLEISDR